MSFLGFICISFFFFIFSCFREEEEEGDYVQVCTLLYNQMCILSLSLGQPLIGLSWGVIVWEERGRKVQRRFSANKTSTPWRAHLKAASVLYVLLGKAYLYYEKKLVFFFFVVSELHVCVVIIVCVYLIFYV